MSAPRAFVSHSHVDREKAVALATALRGRGVDAWIDQWEIQPGDSLIQKIFSEGLQNCQVFLILLSQASVSSRWVREELDVALVKRIEGVTRVVPVLLEKCDVPNALSALMWIELGVGVDDAAEKIADVAHGRREAAPPVRPVAPSLSLAVPGLSRDAAQIAVYLSGGLDTKKGRPPMYEAKPLADGVSMTPERTNDAVEELESLGLVTLHRFLGTAPFSFGIVQPTYALAHQLRGTGALTYDPEEDVLVVAAAVNAKGDADGPTLAAATRLSPGRINGAVAYLEQYGLARVHHFIGTGEYEFGIVESTSALRRFVAANAR